MKIRLNCTTTYFDCAFFVPSICGGTFSPQQTGSTERRPSFATFLAPIFPGAPAPSLSLAGCHKSAIKMMYGPIENGYASSGALSLSLSAFSLLSFCLFVNVSVSLPLVGQRINRDAFLFLPSTNLSSFFRLLGIYTDQLRCVGLASPHSGNGLSGEH